MLIIAVIRHTKLYLLVCVISYQSGKSERLIKLIMDYRTTDRVVESVLYCRYYRLSYPTVF